MRVCAYLGRKVVAELELLEEGRHDDGGEEEDDAPEEDVGDIGPFGAAGAADELATLFNAILQHTHVPYGACHEQQSSVSRPLCSLSFLFFFFLRTCKKLYIFLKFAAFTVICMANPI